ncbi:MAG: DEAD/DEAH box helicase [Candidatus Sericytochromatia bacterium]|nr:DEAD/DEAH box helicase [Candidatus Sericytochromatia bacterium]
MPTAADDSTGTDAPALVAAFAATQPFALDGFQQAACLALATGHSVLVAVPTGAGKTVVAEFAVWLARSRGRQAIITTPLKALSNQKYYELRRRWPGDVGLLTGDVAWHPEAPILVMTTEVLRNRLLARDALGNVDQIVLDEAHFLADRDRGTVWEEVILLAPPHACLTALSATLPNADELAGWMTAVHRPTTVISEEVRPVPLRPMVAGTTLVPYDVAIAQSRDRTRRVAQRVDWHDLPILVRELSRQELLPAIVFTFSRQRCEQQVAALIDAGSSLLNDVAQASVRAQVDAALAANPALGTGANTRRWLDWLTWGVAPHHAGLLPDLKRLIEHLFQQGLLRVVVATETLAAGINMPARTVVISRLMKPSREGERMLSVAEFRQMAGRAGRRGMDVVGYVVLVPGGPEDWPEISALLHDPVEPLWSQFHLSFATAALLAGQFDPPAIRRFLERTFAHYQTATRRRDMEQQLSDVQDHLARWSIWCPVTPHELRTSLHGLYERSQARPDRRSRQSSGLSQPDVPCHRCRQKSACADGIAAMPSWVATESTLQRQLTELGSALWQRFRRQRQVLADLGCLDRGRLTTAGEVLAHLRTKQDLAALFAWAELDGLPPAAMAALASTVVGHRDSARRWHGEPLVGPARAAVDRVHWACAGATDSMRRHGLKDAPPWLDEGAAGLVERWAEGADWAGLVRLSGIDEGELVWHLRQVIDMLWQFRQMPATPPALRLTLTAAIDSIDRAVVRQVEQSY